MAVLSDEQRRRQRSRNRALAAVLFGLVIMFYVITMARIAGPG
jgi:hypothetical protein